MVVETVVAVRPTIFFLTSFNQVKPEICRLIKVADMNSGQIANVQLQEDDKTAKKEY